MSARDQSRGERNGWPDSPARPGRTGWSYGMPEWYWRLTKAVLFAVTVCIVLGLAVGVVVAVWWLATR